jgi:putative zinc finger/helix-turn-helix YgiT family protein
MKCPKCGTRTKRIKAEHSLSVSGVELRGEVIDDTCPACGYATMAASELERFELNAAAALASHGVCTGEAFRFIRKALGMRAADVAEVLGTTPETVSRWETGQREVDRHVFALLGELAVAAAEGRESPAERFKALASADRVKPGVINVRRASSATGFPSSRRARDIAG